MYLLMAIFSVPDLPVSYVTLGMVALAAIIVVSTLAGVFSRYRKISPNRALVVYGKGDFKVLTGGATIVWPIINEAFELDLSAFQLELDLQNAPNKDRIPINLKAMATCKISKVQDRLKGAAENFGRSPMEDVKQKINNVLEGHLRVVIGQIDMDTVLSKRDEFNQKIQQEAAGELSNLGIDVVILNILEVSDSNGVIEALGRPMIARIKAEAAIQEADQLRRQTIEVTNATREAETTKADNETKIAEAQRNKVMKTAGYDAEVAKQRAITEQAGPLASAEARKAVVQAEVSVEQTRAVAETSLQSAIQERNRAQLEATVIVDAEAEKRRVLITAEGAANARTTKAAAEKTALTAEGEGEASKAQSIGMAQAAVTKQTGLATAEVEKQIGLSQAAATEAKLLASATGTKAELLSQAEGRKAMVDAYASMDANQRKLFLTTLIMDRMPVILESLGEAGKQIIEQVAQVAMVSLGSIKELTVYDTGSANGQGSAIDRVTNMAPQALLNLYEKLKATGALPGILKMLQGFGLDFGSIEDTSVPVVGEMTEKSAS